MRLRLQMARQCCVHMHLGKNSVYVPQTSALTHWFDLPAPGQRRLCERPVRGVATAIQRSIMRQCRPFCLCISSSASAVFKSPEGFVGCEVTRLSSARLLSAVGGQRGRGPPAWRAQRRARRRSFGQSHRHGSVVLAYSVWCCHDVLISLAR